MINNLGLFMENKLNTAKNLVLFSYFYNEEYLLPWWCEHHKKIFDHAVLVDYNSNDRSVEIIKSICPTWEIRKSSTKDFLAKTSDMEIMYAEASVGPAYKLALGSAEFLMVNKNFKEKLIDLENKLQDDHIFEFSYQIRRFTMVDDEPEKNPKHDDFLFKQKHHGFRDLNHINYEYRHLHNSICGQYVQGRHDSKVGIQITNFSKIGYELNKQQYFLPGEKKISCEDSNGIILWYGFSPWNDQIIKRKLHVKDNIPKKELISGFAGQHFWPKDKLVQTYNKFLKKSINYNLQDSFDFWK